MSHDQYVLRFMTFLRLANSAESRQIVEKLDRIAEHLLLALALAWSSGRKITVIQAMHESPEISPTSAHRRLKMLRQQGFIALITDVNDNRIKYVVTTPLTRSYLAVMGQHLTRACA